MGRLPSDEDTYLSSLGEMYNTLLVNLTDMSDGELVDLKQRAERRIVRNFSMTTRLELAQEDARRISVILKEKIKDDGALSVLKWTFGKVKEKVKRI